MEVSEKFTEFGVKLDGIVEELEKKEAKNKVMKEDAKKAFDKAQKPADEGMMKRPVFIILPLAHWILRKGFVYTDTLRPYLTEPIGLQQESLFRGS